MDDVELKFMAGAGLLVFLLVGGLIAGGIHSDYQHTKRFATCNAAPDPATCRAQVSK